MTSVTQKRTALLQALWRKAFQEPKPVTIRLKDRKEANRIRFDLYASVRAAKENPALDPGLNEAAAGCSITYLDEQTLQISRRTVEDSLADAAKEFGIDLEAVSAAPTTELEARFRESLAGGGMAKIAAAQAEADRKREAKLAEGQPIPYELPPGEGEEATDRAVKPSQTLPPSYAAALRNPK